MADNSIPPRFEISNQGEIAGTVFGPGCTEITFNPSGPLTMWSAIHLSGKFFGFQQSDTGYWATAVNGQILACPDFSQEQQSTFQVIHNGDGTYLVVLNTTKAVWTVKSDGSLGLGSAISGPENSFDFIEV